jgi:hypothetical protein
MFQRDQKPAGEQKSGAACEVKQKIQRTGTYRCRRCGTYRDEPAPHYAIMQILCAGGVEEFSLSAKLDEADARDRARYSKGASGA